MKRATPRLPPQTLLVLCALSVVQAALAVSIHRRIPQETPIDPYQLRLTDYVVGTLHGLTESDEYRVRPYQAQRLLKEMKTIRSAFVGESDPQYSTEIFQRVLDARQLTYLLHWRLNCYVSTAGDVDTLETLLRRRAAE